MVHGTTDYNCNKGRKTDWRKVYLEHGLGEGEEDGNFVFVGERIEKIIVVKIHLLEKCLEADPSAILLR